MHILFKIFLILSTLYVGYIFFFPRQALIFQRLVGLFLAAVTIFAILFPSITTVFANKFSIGRGVDFIFYCLHVSILYMLARQHQRIQKIQSNLTVLVQDMALKESNQNAPR